MEENKMKLIDADKLPHYDGTALSAVAVARAVENAPTVDAVPKNMRFHVDTYDDMTEEYSIEELTLEEMLDEFTDEGYPNALNALDALEGETCI